jgi:hypothetical protein
LALRGDPPKGSSEWTATEGGFEHAIDLVVSHLEANRAYPKFLNEYLTFDIVIYSGTSEQATETISTLPWRGFRKGICSRT